MSNGSGGEEVGRGVHGSGRDKEQYSDRAAVVAARGTVAASARCQHGACSKPCRTGLPSKDTCPGI